MRLGPRPSWAYAALWLLLTSLGCLASAPPASAAPVTVTPEVARLPVGALPALPYVNWPARRIVDGKRRVDISGIQGRVIELHKVDGGYLLRRRISTPAQYDLVFVSNRGGRKVLAAGVAGTLPVSRRGDKVIVNVGTGGGAPGSYIETRVLALPGGQVLHRRDFGSFPPGLYGFGIDRALIVTADAAGPPAAVWWTPRSDALDLLRPNVGVESADLSAWDWAVRPRVGSYSVQGLPPHPAPNWPVGPEDVNLTAWSPDDTMIVGNDERTERLGGYGSSAYLVYRASNGTLLLAVLNESPSQATWETNSRVLLRTHLPASSPSTYQLIRCTLSGSCSRVGPRTTEVDGAIIPATRRNS
jgi:hypothetical protein